MATYISSSVKLIVNIRTHKELNITKHCVPYVFAFVFDILYFDRAV